MTKKTQVKKKAPHGGFRQGAGRPEVPSKYMRIPLELVDIVARLVQNYRETHRKKK